MSGDGPISGISPDTHPTLFLAGVLERAARMSLSERRTILGSDISAMDRDRGHGVYAYVLTLTPDGQRTRLRVVDASDDRLTPIEILRAKREIMRTEGQIELRYGGLIVNYDLQTIAEIQPAGLVMGNDRTMALTIETSFPGYERR